MRPIRTERTNFQLLAPPGQEDEVGTLPAEATTDETGIPQIVSVWEPTDEERAAVAAGANVALAVATLPTNFPPVAVGISELEEITVEELAERLAEKAS